MDINSGFFATSLNVIPYFLKLKTIYFEEFTPEMVRLFHEVYENISKATQVDLTQDRQEIEEYAEKHRSRLKENSNLGKQMYVSIF